MHVFASSFIEHTHTLTLSHISAQSFSLTLHKPYKNRLIYFNALSFQNFV